MVLLEEASQPEDCSSSRPGFLGETGTLLGRSYGQFRSDEHRMGQVPGVSEN
jgi:hypothetical protein